jgi:D-arabinose 1-dehydrogenase-like Zn-dependent alcohol dehydrogenase
MSVYVTGTGGLGNCLFQIAAAIYYCEKYKYQLSIKNTKYFVWNKFYVWENKISKNKWRGNFL